jgi:hypothetical protein
MLSPDVVEFLNRGGDSARPGWLEKNPVLANFVTCPIIIIRPTAIPHAKRIAAYEQAAAGRHVHIHYKDDSHRHLLQVNQNTTVDTIMKLIEQVEHAGGTCHVERTFLILFIPAGYHLSIGGSIQNFYSVVENGAAH